MFTIFIKKQKQKYPLAFGEKFRYRMEPTTRRRDMMDDKFFAIDSMCMMSLMMPWRA